MQEPPARLGWSLVRGTGGLEQLRGLIKGLAQDTGQAGSTARGGSYPGVRFGNSRGFGNARDALPSWHSPSPCHSIPFPLPVFPSPRSCRRGAKPWKAPMGAPLLSNPGTEGISALGIHGSCFLLWKVKVCILLPSPKSGKGDFFFSQGMRLFEEKDPAAGER